MNHSVKNMMPQKKNIDEYIKSFPKDRGKKLEQLKKILHYDNLVITIFC